MQHLKLSQSSLQPLSAGKKQRNKIRKSKMQRCKDARCETKITKLCSCSDMIISDDANKPVAKKVKNGSTRLEDNTPKATEWGYEKARRRVNVIT